MKKNSLILIMISIYFSCIQDKQMYKKEDLSGVTRIEIKNIGVEIKGLNKEVVITDSLKLKELIDSFNSSLIPFSEYESGTNNGFIDVKFYNGEELVLTVDNLYSIYHGVLVVVENNQYFTNKKFISYIENSLYSGKTVQDYLNNGLEKANN